MCCISGKSSVFICTQVMYFNTLRNVLQLCAMYFIVCNAVHWIFSVQLQLHTHTQRKRERQIETLAHVYYIIVQTCDFELHSRRLTHSDMHTLTHSHALPISQSGRYISAMSTWIRSRTLARHNHGTATHCKTLHHTATHFNICKSCPPQPWHCSNCNTLQYTGLPAR